MDDAQILQQIENLVEEERKLREDATKGDAPSETHARIKALEVSLDKAWDLLRQRRAKREFGDNTDEAHERSATTVEKYEQ